ncbi:MAG TPA: OB-fold domain-containing protein [Acidimicrobiales bacterium]|nr:OB-fold domain-containing protein [Acidimicrobiales bacterium]
MSDQPAMKRFEPPAGEASEPFWEATREKRFLVQRCDACDVAIFYPREVCPGCLSSESLSWRESSGRGTIYAASVQEKPANPLMADRVPYVVALVELEDGIRLMSNVVNCEPYDATVGRPVTLTWEELSDGRHLPQFELEGAASA